MRSVIRNDSSLQVRTVAKGIGCKHPNFKQNWSKIFKKLDFHKILLIFYQNRGG